MKKIDAVVVTRYLRCKQMAKEVSLECCVDGDFFRLNGEKGTIGCFDTVDELFSYLCGYCQGRLTFKRDKVD